jgi:DNA replication protein DnaC
MPDLIERARALGLHGLVAHSDEIGAEPWVQRLIEIEEAERQRRGLERRLQRARLGRFKPIADFDWSWPKAIDREDIDELFRLRFLDAGTSVVLVGPSGVGKSMIAKNLAHQVVLAGRTARFATASAMLGELAAQDGARALGRAVRRYTSPALLAVDEVGYLAYGTRHADLLFEVVTRRYELGRPLLLTTNKAFKEWGEVFPSAACVVALVDRLVHNSEILAIEGESYRLKEAEERAERRKTERRRKRKADR